MKLIELDWNPTDRQLRQFGGICVVVLPMLGWLWGGGDSVIALLAATGIALGAVGMVKPQALKPVFLALAIAAMPVGMLVGELAMALIFFGVLLPIGLFFRLVKRDVLQMKRDDRAKTYWQATRQSKPAASYYRQS